MSGAASDQVGVNYDPCLSISKHHAVYMEMRGLDLIRPFCSGRCRCYTH